MTDRKKEEIALFRFGVIFPLLDAGLPKGGMRQLIGEIARKNYEIPYSSRVRISEGTVRNWYYRYIRDRSIESLLPKGRKDKGQTRTVDFEAANELIRRKAASPEVPLTTLVKMIGEEDGMNLKLHSAYRLIANWNRNNLNPEERNQRRFEMESCNDCWMLDAMSGPKVIVKEGNSTRNITAHCFAFMDDRSRLITHAQFYLNEKAESLLDCMWKAFGRRGLPVRIYTDNGSAMRDFRLRFGLASLEVQLTYATAYHPQSKAKLERFWRTMRMQFLPTLPQEITLYDLNKALDSWINTYNNRYHSGIDMSPIERYIDDIEAVRPAPADLPKYFRFRETRLVSEARTVSFNKTLYEVPLGYAGKTVELRYFSSEGPIEAFFNDRSIGILKPVDLVNNSRTYRGGRSHAK